MIIILLPFLTYLPEFNVFRRDRGTTGSGVGLWIRWKFHAEVFEVALDENGLRGPRNVFKTFPQQTAKERMK